MLVRELDIEDKVIQADHFDESTQEEHEEFLRSIFEADQEGENEEAGEVNEMLARNEKKWRFYSVDLQRGQDALDAWRAVNRGNRHCCSCSLTSCLSDIRQMKRKRLIMLSRAVVSVAVMS